MSQEAALKKPTRVTTMSASHGDGSGRSCLPVSAESTDVLGFIQEGGGGGGFKGKGQSNCHRVPLNI